MPGSLASTTEETSDISATITNEAIAELGLKRGVEAWAVIKASDVMIDV
jgi:molybdopterin-binding protein